MSNLELVILTEDPSRHVIDDGDALIIGRESSCDLAIDENKASRKHCKVWRDGSTVKLKDLGSRNGTQLDGRTVEGVAQILLGQRISVGKTTIVLLEAGAPIPGGNDTVATGNGNSTDALEKLPATQEGQTKFRLVGLKGDWEGRVLHVPAGEVTIGRTSANTFQLNDNGVSSRHARIIASRGSDTMTIQDLGSSNGTFVERERITQRTTLLGNEAIAFGPIPFRVEREGGATPAPVSEPQQVRPSGRAPAARSSAVMAQVSQGGGKRFLLPVLIGVAFIGLAAAIVHLGSSKPKAEETAVRLQGKKGAKVDEEPRTTNNDEAFATLIERMDYVGAQQLQQKRFNAISPRLVRLLERHLKLFRELYKQLQIARKDKERLPSLLGYTDVEVIALTTDSIEFTRKGGNLERERWQDLSWGEVAVAYEELKIKRQWPIDYASFIAFHGDKKGATALIRKSLLEEDCTFSEAEDMLEELDWNLDLVELTRRKVVTTTGPKNGTEDPDKTDPKTKTPLPPQRNDAELDERIKEEAGEVFALGKLFRYNEAVKLLEKLIDDAKSPGLKLKLRGDLNVLMSERAVFERLCRYINQDGIDVRRTPFDTSLEGRLAGANEESYTIRLKQGEISDKWRFLGPDRVLKLYDLLPLSDDVLLGRGIYAYERGKLASANTSLIRLLKKSPDMQKRVDRYLAYRLGIPVPKDGFVPYNGKLVTPEEQMMRAKGLVRYGDRWVPPEDKEKLEAGYVKYKGKWIAQADKKLIDQGYVKIDGRWVDRAEANKIKSDWDKAWELETEYLKLRSNMDIQYNEDLCQHLDAAYRAYKEYWGKAPRKKLQFYAFKNFQDYQKYCLANNARHLLGAAGFALPHKNLCVGYNKINNKKSMTGIMVHEASHLFYGRTHSTMIPSWFAEGMSTFHEAFKWDDPKKKDKMTTGVWNKSRFFGLRRVMNTKDWMTLRELMSGNALNSINTSRMKATAFYSEAWALYYFLENTEDEKLAKGWKSFRNKVESGALNKNMRGGQRGIATAAINLFTQEVGTPEAVEAKLKVYYEQKALKGKKPGR